MIQVTQIGGLAHAALQRYDSGKVNGVTSKGVFLNLRDRILFLTEAPYKSPFNLHLENIAAISSSIQNGDSLTVENQVISIRKGAVELSVAGAEIWKPSRPLVISRSAQAQKEQIDWLIQRMFTLEPQKGWLFLGSSISFDLNPAEDRIRQITGAFYARYREASLKGCLEAAKPIMGLGSGLTPSGDDWLAGFMLLQARLDQSMQRVRPFNQELAQGLVKMAFDRTTKISANRIQAACEGWAEEIFLEVIDALFSDQAALSEMQVMHLLGFGHSSGVDTCLGIQAGLNSLN